MLVNHEPAGHPRRDAAGEVDDVGHWASRPNAPLSRLDRGLDLI